MTDKSIKDLAEDSIRQSFGLRKEILDGLVKNSRSDDGSLNVESIPVEFLTKMLDANDRLSLGVKKLAGEDEDRTNSQRLIDATEEWMKRQGNRHPYEVDITPTDDTPSGDSTTFLPEVNMVDMETVNGITISEGTLSEVSGQMDYETLVKEFETPRDAEIELD